MTKAKVTTDTMKGEKPTRIQIEKLIPFPETNVCGQRKHFISNFLFFVIYNYMFYVIYVTHL